MVFPDRESKGGDDFFQRRKVAFVTWRRPYSTYDAMDADLAALRARRHRTVHCGPFGVFRAADDPPSRAASHVLQLPPPPPAEFHAAADQMWLSTELREHALLTAAALAPDPPFFDETALLQFQPEHADLLNLVFHKNLAPSVAGPPAVAPHLRPYYEDSSLVQAPTSLDIQLHAPSKADDSTDPVDGDLAHASTRMPDSVMSIVRSPLEPLVGFDVALPRHGVGLPVTALQIQPLARYLVNYYDTEVADLMTVIPLTENPWKTIYLPRALMAIGELAAIGKTSPAKNALLNALLAVAAFNLQSKFTRNSNQMRFYLNLGIRLRNQASVFVKALLGGGKSDVRRCVASEKYKDILCAVMSMISVDLVWGTMQDTNFYIKWCERVIYTKMQTKSKLSAKARILHRIFSSMKLIQDLTCLDVAGIQEDYAMQSQYEPDSLTKLGPDAHHLKGHIAYIVDLRKMSLPMFVNMKLVNTNKNDENFATDALYGLPSSLIALFSETVLLVRRKIHNDHVIGGPQPAEFTTRADSVKEKLRRWTLDWKLGTDPDLNDFYTSMHEATFHHIMSFYHALCIYFARLIEGQPADEIQNQVATTLKHLNSIQKLISEDEAHIIPLFWQGFIAGCEATSPELQLGFKKWGADIAQYLGSYWGARQIMLEVWRRKQVHEPRSDWVSVITDWEMNLMLN